MPKRPLPPKAAIKRISAENVAGLRDILLDLSVHHNKVAHDFAGIYPVLPVDKQLARTADEIRRGTAMVEVVRIGDAPHGFSKASFEAGHGKVDWLYVDERLRGLGYGELLLNRMLEFLRGKTGSVWWICRSFSATTPSIFTSATASRYGPKR